MEKKTVVIVGGGTAGLVIANNLQDDFDVVVVEKSKYKRYPFIFKIPLLIGLLYRRKKLTYISKREMVLANGRQIPFFESNVLGGASVVNGCVHTVGSKLRWEGILSKFNASYDDLLSSYGRLYTSNPDDSGKINLMLAPQNSIDLAFVNALNRNQVPAGDMNYSNEEHCGPIYDTTRGIFRSSVMDLIRKAKFKTYIGEVVKRVLVDGDERVVGVETDRKVIKSDFVILSGGVVGTCSLLLREKENKESFGNIKHLEVGSGVQDHTNLRVNVLTKSEIGSLNEVSRSFRKKLSMMVGHFLGKLTLMVGTGATSGVHLDLDGDGKVDTRIQVVQFTETGRHGSDGKYFSDTPGFSFSITPINPDSKGKIKVVDGDVVIDPMFLSEKNDLEILKLALRYCLKLLRSKPLSDYVLEIVSEQLIESDPERYINENIFSGHHLIGGAQNAVGDDFNVKGVRGFYICDASIFDGYAASNIHSSVVLIADIFSRKFIASNASR